MGTKNNPGAFDCYAEAEPDEPMFILLGRDPTASYVVSFWEAMKRRMREMGFSKTSDEKLAEARECAKSMHAWAASKGKEESGHLREAFLANAQVQQGYDATHGGSQGTEISRLRKVLEDITKHQTSGDTERWQSEVSAMAEEAIKPQGHVM